MLKPQDILETKLSGIVDQELELRSTSDDDQPLTTPLNTKSALDGGDDDVKNTDDYELPTINSPSSNNDETSTASVNTDLKKSSEGVAASIIDTSSSNFDSTPESEWPSITKMKHHDDNHDEASLTNDKSQSNHLASLSEQKDTDTLSTSDQSKPLSSTSANISSGTSPITEPDGNDQSNRIPDLSSSEILPSNSLEESSDNKKKLIEYDDSFVSELGELRLADEE